MKSFFSTLLIMLFFSQDIVAQNKIQEARFVTLGSIQQWITIRGEHKNSPLLLILHGGPGDAQSCFTDVYAAYEKKFVVVQWDQRGSGKTFGKYHEQTPNLTIDQLISDGIELANYLKKRFRRNDLIVLGHSLGTAIATGMVTKRPDLFKAYVGTGQIASWAESVQWLFKFMKKKATESNDSLLLDELNKIGTPDPKNADQFFRFTRTRRKYLNAADTSWFGTMRKEAGKLTKQELNNLDSGMRFSGKVLLPYQLEERLSTNSLTFKLPYLIVQGNDDLFTPTEPVRNYFDKITAPRKKLVIIENAGHFAFVTDMNRFIREIEKFVSDN
ncbi:MAG TPA: alpha/beta hydrolase [Chitinophagaceae bacterium]|nr:alpha/beta hydrolase [Chitinophagaceae bacterium]